MAKKFLIRHLGNMGDMIFFIPPVLASLKKHYPDCHVTFVTAWGYKDRRGRWGRRGMGGFSIHLIQTNPHIDQLVHYHDTALSLAGNICHEDGQTFPTWNKIYYDKQKSSGHFDAIYELDFGLKPDDNPLAKIYQYIGLPEETYSDYKIHLTENDKQIAEAVINLAPRPRIILLEGLDGFSTRGWDPAKVNQLTQAIQQTFKVSPIWFGGRHTPFHQGRPLTLRQNIAQLIFCHVGIGVMSGPLHFAAAVNLPTLTLFCDQPLHRAAPAFFLNQYIKDKTKPHRTLLGPTPSPIQFLKPTKVIASLTATEQDTQQFKTWTNPGRQATKSCLAAITVDEVMAVLHDMIH